jgi:hypothetical protein
MLSTGGSKSPVPSRVRVEEGPHGPRLAADETDSLTTAEVRELMERGRR